jgi:hypothetical protein
MNDTELARNYILDRLSEEDRAECERRFLFDPEFESLLLDQERELLDDYVNLRLSDEEAAAVQLRVAQQPGHLYRLRFAESLRRAAVAEIDHTFKPSPFRRWRALLARRQFLVFGGLAASAALAIAIIVAVVIRPSRLPGPPPALSAASASQRAHTSSPANLAPSQASTPPAPADSQTARSMEHLPNPGAAATFLLLADQQRGAGEETNISYKPGIETLRLQLTTQEGLDPGHYSATVTDAHGANAFSASHLVPREEAGRLYIELRIPSANLPAGEYTVTLVDEKAAPQPPLTFRFKLSTAQPDGRSPQ